MKNWHFCQQHALSMGFKGRSVVTVYRRNGHSLIVSSLKIVASTSMPIPVSPASFMHLAVSWDHWEPSLEALHSYTFVVPQAALGLEESYTSQNTSSPGPVSHLSPHVLSPFFGSSILSFYRCLGAVTLTWIYNWWRRLRQCCRSQSELCFLVLNAIA